MNYKKENDSGVEQIGEILKRYLNRSGFLKKLNDYKVFLRWEDIVGDKVAMYAKPYRIKGSTLWVVVSNSVWLQELKFLEKEIIKQIQIDLKEKKIKKIYFVLGELH
jgi:predicted nucleic acid-binding Zn ribbon protein